MFLNPVVQVEGGSALLGAGPRSPSPPFALRAAIVTRIANPARSQVAPAFRAPLLARQSDRPAEELRPHRAGKGEAGDGGNPATGLQSRILWYTMRGK